MIFDSIYLFIKHILQTASNYSGNVTIKNEVLDVCVYYYSSDLTIDEATDLNALFADCIDVDGSMQILVCASNLTITENVILTPPYRCKGFVIYANTLTNNGTISMTARGASAEGQDIYLFQDEYIPAVGALGGEKIGGVSGSQNGNPGINGISRQTGGGGSGSRYSNYSNQWSGAGGTGTSFSGGSGGGGYAGYLAGNYDYSATDASSFGGEGGNAFCRRTSANNHNATGGAGNDAGYNARRTSGAGVANVTWERTSENGTGGTLILFTKKLINNGLIASNGSNSGLSGYNDASHCRTGGASGGGSINIFYKSYINSGNVTAAGGVAAQGALKGGDGGNGCITLYRMAEMPPNQLLSTAIIIKILHNNTINLYKKLGLEYNHLLPQLPDSYNYCINTTSAILILKQYVLKLSGLLGITINPLTSIPTNLPETISLLSLINLLDRINMRLENLAANKIDILL